MFFGEDLGTPRSDNSLWDRLFHEQDSDHELTGDLRELTGRVREGLEGLQRMIKASVVITICEEKKWDIKCSVIN